MSRITTGVGLCILLAGCGASTAPTADTGLDMAAMEEELMRLDREFDSDTAERGSVAWLERFAEDGELVGGGAAIVGAQAVSEAVAGFDTGLVTLRWQPVEARVGRHGEMGYTRGTYERHVQLPDGGEVAVTGGYVTVWQKQESGEWKIVLDVGSPDPEPPPAGQEGQ